MPTCHHYFHVVCIDVWLQKQSTCPICRLPLKETFEVSPIFGVFQGPDSAELPRGHSKQWLMPRHQRSEGIDNNQEIHDSVPINIGALHGEPETGTKLNVGWRSQITDQSEPSWFFLTNLVLL